MHAGMAALAAMRMRAYKQTGAAVGGGGVFRDCRVWGLGFRVSGFSGFRV